jgi:hypothetical protein
VEHPICTALLRGWVTDDRGRRLHWPVDRYREEGIRKSRWFVDGVIKYHRMLETYVNTLIDSGFALGGCWNRSGARIPVRKARSGGGEPQAAISADSGEKMKSWECVSVRLD